MMMLVTFNNFLPGALMLTITPKADVSIPTPAPAGRRDQLSYPPQSAEGYFGVGPICWYPQ